MNKWSLPKRFQIIIIISDNKILNILSEYKGSYLPLHKYVNKVKSIKCKVIHTIKSPVSTKMEKEKKKKKFKNMLNYFKMIYALITYLFI